MLCAIMGLQLQEQSPDALTSGLWQGSEGRRLFHRSGYRVLRYHADVLEEERPLVGLLINDHAGGLTGTVPRIGLHADQHWGITLLLGLQCADELEAVRRDHAVVVVGRHHQGGRVARGLDVVQG